MSLMEITIRLIRKNRLRYFIVISVCVPVTPMTEIIIPATNKPYYTQSKLG
jgi:hypothetical protein